MRPTLTILIVLFLQNLSSAQLLISPDESPVKFDLVNKVPVDLAGNTTLKFVRISILFDGGSSLGVFKKEDGKNFLILFPHPGHWTQDAKKNRTQPIAILVEGLKKGEMYPEIERGSPYEKRLVQLLNDDLSSKEHAPKQINELRRVRDSVRDRTVLREIRERFPSAFEN